MERLFQRLVFNFDGKVRTERLRDRDHYVVPGVMMAEGVWSGSAGPIFYSNNELKRCCPAWNHKPIVVYHPKDENGNEVSGCLPHVLNTRMVGVALNTSWDNAQKTEAWIDVERCREVDSRIIDRIEAKEPLEISTGLFAEAKRFSNKKKYGDKEYKVEAVNHQPDHLAILPDQIGAFSVEDGGGLRANQLLMTNLAQEPERNREAMVRAVGVMLGRVGASLVGNELSFSETTSQIHDLLAQAYGEPGQYWRGYVCDVFKGHVIFRAGDSDYPGGPELLQKYSAVNNVVSLVGEAIEVKRKVQYVAAGKTYEAVDEDLVANDEEKPMDKKKHIDGLIANGGFAEADRKDLEAMPEGLLFKITNKAVEVVPTPPAQEKTTQDYIAGIPDPRVRSVLTNAIAVENAERVKLVKKIMASPRNTITQTDLEASPLTNLQAIANFIPDPAPADQDYQPFIGSGAKPTVNYSAAAGGVPTQGVQEEAAPTKFLLTPGLRKGAVAANGAK